MPQAPEGSANGSSSRATAVAEQGAQQRRPPGFGTRRPVRRGAKAFLARLKSSVAQPVPREIEELIRLVKARHPKASTKEIVQAYEVARVAHQGQLRKSGEPFIAHPVGVALIVAELGMDTTSVVAALLHDSVEDTDLELEDLRSAFGAEVSGIIDGLTKLDRIGFTSREQERVENLRKMILAMARDLRVLVIKLADRLHNMRTLDPLEPSKRELVATETLEIYSPLAHRLGMAQIKSELEDLSFRALHPKRYQEIEQMVTLRQPERSDYLGRVEETVRAKLREIKVKAEITGRPKHYYSIYEKMVGRGREFDEIFDLVAIRIIVETVKDCYAVLGVIHALWKPVPGRFKDYIAMPKFNLYQSLHTSVVGPEGKPLEVQIRSREMHQAAEWGVAAHWRYKEDPRGKGGDEAAWMKRMLDLQQTEDPGEFLESLRLDLFADEVFVFTPKGDVVELPKGSTSVDFAYAIHTEVGHACVGARVDGRLVPLDHVLASGETVEVLTSKSHAGPSRDWLKTAVTPRARTKIKQWFTKERRDEAIVEGKDALTKAIRRAGLPLQRAGSEGSLEALAGELKFPSVEALAIAVGEGRLSAQSAVARLVKRHVEALEEEPQPPPPARLRTKAPTTQGVAIKGVDQVAVKLARCCMPVPGDAIIGFVTRGRGVSVHRRDCPNLAPLSSEPDRFVEAAWHGRASGVFTVTVQVEALDRPRLLRDISTTISDFGVNITFATSAVGRGIAHLRFTFDLAEPSQLDKIVATVRRIEAVYDAYRLTPGRR